MSSWWWIHFYAKVTTKDIKSWKQHINSCCFSGFQTRVAGCCKVCARRLKASISHELLQTGGCALKWLWNLKAAFRSRLAIKAKSCQHPKMHKPNCQYTSCSKSINKQTDNTKGRLFILDTLSMCCWIPFAAIKTDAAYEPRLTLRRGKHCLAAVGRTCTSLTDTIMHTVVNNPGPSALQEIEEAMLCFNLTPMVLWKYRFFCFVLFMRVYQQRTAISNISERCTQACQRNSWASPFTHTCQSKAVPFMHVSSVSFADAFGSLCVLERGEKIR